MRIARLVSMLVLALLLLPVSVEGRGGSSRHRSTAPRVHKPSSTPGVRRDPKGRIARSSRARTQFRKSHPCPATGRSTGKCPGYVIDHVVPLKRGGSDQPGNMQWQPTQAAKAKDRVE
jgi:hypothetical protein